MTAPPPPPQDQYRAGYEDRYKAEYEAQYRKQYEAEYQRRQSQYQDQNQGMGGEIRTEMVPPKGVPKDMENRYDPRDMGGQGGQNSPSGPGPRSGEQMMGNRGDYGREGYGYGNGNEDQSEEMEKRISEETLKRMRQGIKPMVSGIERVKKIIARLATKNVSVPAEYGDLVAKLETATKVVANATEYSDSVQDAMDVIQDSGQDLSEIGPKLGMLEQMPRIIKEAEKRVSQARKQLAKAKARAEKAGVNVTDIALRVETMIGEIESAIKNVKANTTDPEEAMETLRETAFERLQDLYSDIALLEKISNGTKVIKEVKKEITRIESVANRLKRQKKDVTELLGLVTKMKAKLAEAEQSLKDSASEPDTLFEIMSEGESLHNDALEEMAKLQGTKTEIDRQFEVTDQTKTSETGAAAARALDKFFDLFR
jgi:chromosome segregation ATPase